jgi:CBS domain-containing protein
MKLRDLMVSEVITISPSDTTAKAAQRMRGESIGCLVVAVDDALDGIITDRDLLACLSEAHDPNRCTVAVHMTRSVLSGGPDEEVLQAAETMAEKRIKRLPIVEQEKLVGLVSFSDIADLVHERWQDLWWKFVPLTRLIRAQKVHRRGIARSAGD